MRYRIVMDVTSSSESPLTIMDNFVAGDWDSWNIKRIVVEEVDDEV